MRCRVAGWLRLWSDRLDHRGAVKATGMTMTLERGRGWVLHGYDDPMRGRGFLVCYAGDDEYDRAHTEAENPT